MATPGTTPDPEESALGGRLSVEGAALCWAFDGPTLFLRDIEGDVVAFERLFALADVFARGRFADALVVRFRAGDPRLAACRRLGFDEAADVPLEGYVSLVREVL